MRRNAAKRCKRCKRLQSKKKKNKSLLKLQGNTGLLVICFRGKSFFFLFFFHTLSFFALLFHPLFLITVSDAAVKYAGNPAAKVLTVSSFLSVSDASTARLTFLFTCSPLPSCHFASYYIATVVDPSMCVILLLYANQKCHSDVFVYNVL